MGRCSGRESSGTSSPVFVARRSGYGLGLVVLLGAVLLLVACGRSTPKPPAVSGGTYVSQQYHFRVTYPAGWAASVAKTSSSSVPLTVVFTEIDQPSAAGSVVSAFTVTVLSLSDAAIARDASTMASDPTKHATTLSGHTAYVSTPLQQPLQGSTATVTHTEYDLVSGSYEYQLSTDALTGSTSQAALTQMLQQFTLLP